MKQFNCLDLIKFLMAICVVGIHCQALENKFMLQPLRQLFSMAVPFFFLCSGFFLEKGVFNDAQHYKNFTLRITKLFIIWILIYLPIDLFLCAQSPNFIKHLLDTSLHLLQYGETAYSWPLWYLYSLIIFGLILSLTKGLKFNVEIIFGIGIILYLLPTEIRSIYGRLFQSLPMAGAGILIYRLFNRIQHRIYIGTALFAVSLIIGSFFTIEPLISLIGGIGLFFVGLDQSINKTLSHNNEIYRNLRKCSMFIYFTHMYILFFFWLLSIIIIDIRCNNIYAYWLESSIITVLISFAFTSLSKKQYFRWINNLI